MLKPPHDGVDLVIIVSKASFGEKLFRVITFVLLHKPDLKQFKTISGDMSGTLALNLL